MGLRSFPLDSKSADDQFTDEGIPTSVSSTAGDDESSSKPSSSSYQHVFPAHVYKECFPSTIYRTGEARPIRVSDHLVRLVTLRSCIAS